MSALNVSQDVAVLVGSVSAVRAGERFLSSVNHVMSSVF